MFCDLEEKDVLIDTLGGAVFSTPHYDGYPAMLVRLRDIALGHLAELLEDSYRSRAPANLVAEMERHDEPG